MLPSEFWPVFVAGCARIDVDPIDLLAVAANESGLNPRAWNEGGRAAGLWQLTTAGTSAAAPPVFDSVPGHTTTDGSVTWTAIGPVPVYGSYGKVYIPGTLTIATAGAYALTTTQAAYETIEATGAAASITVTTSYDGQVIRAYNASGGAITVVGFAVPNGQTFVGTFVGGGTNAWKKQSLF